MKTINLKENSPSVELAVANFLIELDVLKAEGEQAVKILHGYGSHGIGGSILLEIRELVRRLKKQKKIKNYFTGSEWDIANQKCFDEIVKLKNLEVDDDLGKANPGITIVII